MAVTQYVGARYVPLFADPIEWDSQYAYEPLTIVLHEGNSYTSRQYVPKGIDISNDKFWTETGNYNAQVEQYRQEVLAFDGRITNAQSIADKAYELVKAFDGKKIVVYGDSTAALQPSYMNMFAERMNMEIDNRAISGTAVTPATYKNPTDNSLYALLRAASKSDFSDVDYVFLCYSTNDWQGGAKLFDCGDETHQPSFERALSIAIERLLAFNDKMRIIFVAPVFAHRQFMSSDPNINNAGYLLDDYGYVAEHVMYNYGMGYCSLNSLGVNESNYRDWMVDDSGGIFVHYTTELKNNVVDYLIHSFPWKSKPNEYENGNALPMIHTINAIDTSIYTPYDTNINNDTIVGINAGQKIFTNACNLKDGLRLNGWALNGAAHIKIYPEKNPEKFVVISQHEFGRYSVPLPKMDDVQRLVIENIGDINIRISHVTVTSKLGNTGNSHILDVTPADKVIIGGYVEGEVVYLTLIIGDSAGMAVDQVLATMDVDFGPEKNHVNEYINIINNTITLAKVPTSAIVTSVCLPMYNVGRLHRA